MQPSRPPLPPQPTNSKTKIEHGEPNMKYIHITEEEQQALMQVLDAYVRSAGLNGAQTALVLAQKVQNAEDVEEPEE